MVLKLMKLRGFLSRSPDGRKGLSMSYNTLIMALSSMKLKTSLPSVKAIPC